MSLFSIVTDVYSFYLLLFLLSDYISYLKWLTLLYSTLSRKFKNYWINLFPKCVENVLQTDFTRDVVIVAAFYKRIWCVVPLKNMFLLTYISLMQNKFPITQKNALYVIELTVDSNVLVTPTDVCVYCFHGRSDPTSQEFSSH